MQWNQDFGPGFILLIKQHDFLRVTCHLLNYLNKRNADHTFDYIWRDFKVKKTQQLFYFNTVIV